MKKILILALSVLMMLSFTLFAACTGDDGSSKKNNIVMLNGYNCYDDIATTYLNPRTFFGYFDRNKDDKYIVEGEASYRVNLLKLEASKTPPNFKMKAGGIKTDITDVTEFGLYIYSELDEPFTVIVQCLDAADAIIYEGTGEVAPHAANNLVFPVDRTVIQDTGTAVVNYNIKFSGMTFPYCSATSHAATNEGEGIDPVTHCATPEKHAIFYLDNFYAKTTTDKVQVSPEVQSLIDDIVNTDMTDRSAVEALMDRYLALAIDERQGVYNYNVLSGAMNQFWSQDIMDARELEPNKILFFDREFGFAQVTEKSQGVERYDYTTDMRHGDDAGSLKVKMSNQGTWNSITTTAKDVTAPKEGLYVEFFVYNESDQRKGFKVDWDFPQDFFILQPNEWTRIVAPASELLKRGYILFTGLTDGDGAMTPIGNLYFSSVSFIDLNQMAVDLRVGDDANTVIFFDNELGQDQVLQAKRDILSGMIRTENISFDKEIKKNGEDGSIRFDVDVRYSWKVDPFISYNTLEYEFNEGDYVVFDAYVDMDTTYQTYEVNENGEMLKDKNGNPVLKYDEDGNPIMADFAKGNEASKFINVRFTTGINSYAARVYNKQWSTVLIPASAFITPDATAGKTLMFFYSNVRYAGSIYLSNVKAIPASEVKSIATTGDTEYTLNGIDFVGCNYATAAGTLGSSSYEVTYSSLGGLAVGTCKWSPNGVLYHMESDVVPYYVNGAIRFYVRTESNHIANTRIALQLKDSITGLKGGSTITVTVRNAVASKVYLRNSTNSSYVGEKPLVQVADLGNGYIKYEINSTFNDSWSSEVYDLLIFDITPTFTYTQVEISDISIVI